MREALSKYKDEELVDNNSAIASGGKVDQRSGDDSDNKTRPDSLGETIVHEHKHFTEENSDPVVYNTGQLERQREGFPDKDHVLTISSDLPLRKADPLNKNEECDQPPCRPSLGIKEDSEVLYFDNKKNAITHEWSVRDKCWYEV